MTISERAQQLLAARTPFVHATVVRAQPPTSAYPGDEAILLADGTIEGFVGGQCAQNSVRKAALGVLQAGEVCCCGCFRRRRALSRGARRLRGRQPVPVRRIAGDLPDAAAPAPLIRIYGATPIADALMQLCALLGYDVQREARETTDLADTSAVVIASHGGPEAELIRTALDNGVSGISVWWPARFAALDPERTRTLRRRASPRTYPGRFAHRRQDTGGDRGIHRRRTHRRRPRRQPDPSRYTANGGRARRSTQCAA